MVDIKAKIQQKTQALQQAVEEHNKLNQAIEEATNRRDTMRHQISNLQGQIQALQEIDTPTPTTPAVEAPKVEEPTEEASPD